MRRPDPLLAISFLTGAAALAQEVLWCRVLQALLGAGLVAVVLTQASVFGGFALGGAWGSRGAARPSRAFALVLVGAALHAALLPALAGWAGRLSDLHPRAAPLLSVALLLLPATLLGATFPLLVASGARRGRPERRFPALVVATNTAGAALGALAAGFVLIERLGLRGSLWAAAGIQLASAVAALRLRDPPAPPADAPAPRALPLGAVPLLAAASGFAALGYQALWTHLLAATLRSTVYSFTLVLAAFLAGGALGNRLLAALVPRRDPRALLGGALVAMAAVGLLGTLALARLPELVAARVLPRLPPGLLVAGLAVEGIIAVVVATPLAVASGVGFAAAIAAVGGPRARASGGITFWNGIGCAVAPLLVAGLLARPDGERWAALALAGTVLPGALLLRRLALGAVLVPLLLGALALRTDLSPWRVASQEKLLALFRGLTGTAAVVETPDGSRVLKINGWLFQGGGAGVFTERRQAHLPLLLHRAPRRVLFLGLGTGDTAAAALAYGPEVVVGVELVPGVVEALPWFSNTNGGFFADPRVRLHVTDARRFVRVEGDRYDVIVADLFHPYEAGTADLYTREHFARVAARLRERGLFCQWLPLYQLAPDEVATVTAEFLEAFPDAQALLGSLGGATPILGLVGGAPDFEGVRDRVLQPGLAGALGPVLLDDRLEVQAARLLGPAEVRLLGAGAAPSTADRPTLEFRAARTHYRSLGRASELARANLDRLLALRTPPEGLDPDARAAWRAVPSLVRGYTALGAGDREAARAAFAEALRIAPRFRTAQTAARIVRQWP